LPQPADAWLGLRPLSSRGGPWKPIGEACLSPTSLCFLFLSRKQDVLSATASSLERFLRGVTCGVRLFRQPPLNMSLSTHSGGPSCSNSEDVFQRLSSRISAGALSRAMFFEGVFAFVFLTGRLCYCLSPLISRLRAVTDFSSIPPFEKDLFSCKLAVFHASWDRLSS